jgi:hypothetical protein
MDSHIEAFDRQECSRGLLSRSRLLARTVDAVPAEQWQCAALVTSFDYPGHAPWTKDARDRVEYGGNPGQREQFIHIGLHGWIAAPNMWRNARATYAEDVRVFDPFSAVRAALASPPS